MKNRILMLFACVFIACSCFAFVACGEEKTKTEVCQHEYADIYTCHDRACTKCGEVLKATTQHTFTDMVTAPTCTESGYTLHTCVCGYSEKTDITDALGHDFVKTRETPANCTQPGEVTYKCLRCEEETSEYTPALGHKANTELDRVVNSTCTEQGYTEHTCSVCEEKYQDTYVPALGHKAKTELDEVVPATCTEQGYTKHICSVCEQEYKDTYVEPLGHDYQKKAENKTATCDSYAYLIDECSRCHDQVVTVTGARLAHSFGEDGVCTVCHKNITETLLVSVNRTGSGEAQLILQDEKYGHVVYAEPAGGEYIYQLNIDRATIDTLIKLGYGKLTVRFGNPDGKVHAFHYSYDSVKYYDMRCPATNSGFISNGEFDVYLVNKDGSVCNYIDAKSGLNIFVAFHADGQETEGFAFDFTLDKKVDAEDKTTVTSVFGSNVAYDEPSKTWTVSGIDPVTTNDYRLWIAEDAWKAIADGHQKLKITMRGKDGQGISFSYITPEGETIAANTIISFDIDVPTSGDLSVFVNMSHFSVGGTAPDGFKMTIEPTHTLISETVAPTCVSGGYTESFCEFCDYTERTQEVAKIDTAHHFVNGVCEYCKKNITEAMIVSAYIVGGDGTIQTVEMKDDYGYVIKVAPGATYAIAIDRATIDALVAQGYGTLTYRFGNPDTIDRSFAWWIDGMDRMEGNNPVDNGFISTVEFKVRLVNADGSLCSYINENGIYVYVQYGGEGADSFGAEISFGAKVTETSKETLASVAGTEVTYDADTATWTIRGINPAKQGDYRIWIAEEALAAYKGGSVKITLSALSGETIAFNYNGIQADNGTIEFTVTVPAEGDLNIFPVYIGGPATGFNMKIEAAA